MSTRFYSDSPPVDGRIRLGPEEARHLHRVCRLGKGDVVEVFDGRGSAWRAEILEATANHAILIASDQTLPSRSPTLSITIASAVPKGDRLDWLVEKATELGACRFIPLVTDRSVVDPSDSKLARLRKAVVESCKQCGRDTLMTLSPVTRLNDLLIKADEPIKLLADLDGQPPASWPRIMSARPVILVIGPEGGFTTTERAQASQYGWTTISLGAHILRIETAAIAGSAALFAREEKASE